MNEVPTKPFWQSKTFWAVLITALVGAYKLIAPNYGWDTRWVEGAVLVLGALGLWGVRTADTTIATRPEPSPPSQPDNVVPGPNGDPQ